MAIFDNVINDSPNFKGYTGSPPTTEAEYNALDCCKDKSQAPTWSSISTDMVLEEVKQDRKESYPLMVDQLDMLYWDKVNGTDNWQDVIAKVKADNPKP